MGAEGGVHLGIGLPALPRASLFVWGGEDGGRGREKGSTT